MSTGKVFKWKSSSPYLRFDSSLELDPSGKSSLDELVLEGWDGAGDSMAVEGKGNGEMGTTGLKGECGNIPNAVGEAQGYEAPASSVGGVGKPPDAVAKGDLGW